MWGGRVYIYIGTYVYISAHCRHIVNNQPMCISFLSTHIQTYVSHVKIFPGISKVTNTPIHVSEPTGLIPI